MRNVNLRKMILAALMAALISVAAQLSFPLPFSPVPLTLQVLVVLLAGGLLGPTWGGAAMLLYLLLGVVGLPVFSRGGHGLASLLGPTGGYLMSYPIAAAAVGLLAPPSRAPGLLRTGAAMLAGLVLIYLGGGGWAVVWGGQAMAAVVYGWVLPFVPLDLVKLALATVLSRSVNRALAGQMGDRAYHAGSIR
ncbi:MAG TPA: biotin transporter BioY [Symbiobacteriaceae bacterium]|nr:biotin transporter BioY [Symbiobacteriaceae bacterium]